MISATATTGSTTLEELPADVELLVCSAAGVMFTACAAVAPLSTVGDDGTVGTGCDVAVGVSSAATVAVAVSVAAAGAVDVAAGAVDVAAAAVAVSVICGVAVLDGCTTDTVFVG